MRQAKYSIGNALPANLRLSPRSPTSRAFACQACVSRHGRHDPHLELAFDFARVANFHRVQAEFFERAFEADLVGRQVDVVGFECSHDFRSADAAVQMAVFGGVGLDRDALLGELGRLFAELSLAGNFDLLQLDLVLIDHPFVMVAGLGREALRNEIVVGVAFLHLDDLALLADVLDLVDEQ